MFADRKLRLAARATATALGLVLLAGSGQVQSGSSTSTAIRPFSVHVPQAELERLRRRIAETRWPGKETVADRSQGARLADLEQLVRYWGSRYDWRKAEARLNALPQFVTSINAVGIHFIHVRSRQRNALPMILTHGWPGSVFEFLDVIGPLTEPGAHGASVNDAFDLVIPSLPGYGFSGKPSSTGWDPDHVARVWAELMHRLGYTRYVAQGGDWGAPMRRGAQVAEIFHFADGPAPFGGQVRGKAPEDQSYRLVRRFRRSGRQRLAVAGGYDPVPGPGRLDCDDLRLSRGSGECDEARRDRPRRAREAHR